MHLTATGETWDDSRVTVYESESSRGETQKYGEVLINMGNDRYVGGFVPLHKTGTDIKPYDYVFTKDINQVIPRENVTLNLKNMPRVACTCWMNYHAISSIRRRTRSQSVEEKGLIENV